MSIKAFLICRLGYLVFGDRVDTQGLEGVALLCRSAILPLLLLYAREIMRCIDISGGPPAVHVPLEVRAFAAGLHLCYSRIGASQGVQGEVAT